MADKIKLEVLTPERLVLSESVDEVVVPGLGGELGILPNHTALISQLKTGILTYRTGSEKRQMHVSGGFAEVLPDQVSVMSDVAERPEEIDLERARRAFERAEQIISRNGDDVDFARAELKLQRAMIRIQLAAKGQG
ncbi:MAG: F0F1 ATP synthase subunit epsilon [Acidobacteriota bacterium]|nr:MAG: F0F1 ATP synthase subunit epsilon [Acidobacteriota bacterium]